MKVWGEKKERIECKIDSFSHCEALQMRTKGLIVTFKI